MELGVWLMECDDPCGKNDVHRFTETVIKSGSRTLVTELMMKDTADLSRRDEKEFEESLEQKMSQWWQKMKKSVLQLN